MKRTLIVVLIALTVVVAGCGGPGDAPDEENESPGEDPAGEDPAGGNGDPGGPAGGEEGASLTAPTAIAIG